jgi:hypothetical protein
MPTGDYLMHLSEIAGSGFGSLEDVERRGLSPLARDARLQYRNIVLDEARPKKGALRIAPGSIRGTAVDLGLSRMMVGDIEASALWLQDFTANAETKVADIRMLRKRINQLSDMQLPLGTIERSQLSNIEASLIATELSLPGGAVEASEILRVVSQGATDENVLSGMSKWAHAGIHVPAVNFLHFGRQFSAIVKLLLTDGTAVGTGFLVKTRDVIETADDSISILTCHHVIPGDNGAIDPAQIIAVSDLAPARTIRPNAITKSAHGFLDFCVLSTDLVPGEVDVIRVSESAIPPILASTMATLADNPSAVPVGYPNGGPLTVTSFAQRILAQTSEEIHYEAENAPGMSGAPVLDLLANAMAIHRRIDVIHTPLAPWAESYFAGQGTRISALKRPTGSTHAGS